MNMQTACEVAYKNGYDAGYKAAKEELERKQGFRFKRCEFCDTIISETVDTVKFCPVCGEPIDC